MRIRVTKLFRWQATPREVWELDKGVYRVPEDVDREFAKKAIKFRHAVVLKREGKVAPENKLGAAPASKKKVGRKAVRSGGAGTKSDGADSQEG